MGEDLLRFVFSFSARVDVGAGSLLDVVVVDGSICREANDAVAETAVEVLDVVVVEGSVFREATDADTDTAVEVEE